MNAALDLLKSQPPRLQQQIEHFRVALDLQSFGADGLEAQQLELTKLIPPIHKSIRNKLKTDIKALEFR